MKLQRNSILLSMVALRCVCSASGVHAETVLENKIRNEPPIHVSSSEKPLLVAHFASLIGFIDGVPNNAARLHQLHAAVDQCISVRNGLGMSANPPTEWPTHLNGLREDFYATDRFVITYYQGWVYGGLNQDCSYIEVGKFQSTAVLKSSAGACRIDLIAKTAKGQCNMDVHRNAKIRPSMPVTKDGIEHVAGLACQPRKDILGTVCVAADGKMKPAFPVVLQRESEDGIHLTARQAALDIEVSERVFTPHLQGGFTVK